MAIDTYKGYTIKRDMTMLGECASISRPGQTMTWCGTFNSTDARIRKIINIDIKQQACPHLSGTYIGPSPVGREKDQYQFCKGCDKFLGIKKERKRRKDAKVTVND